MTQLDSVSALTTKRDRSTESHRRFGNTATLCGALLCALSCGLLACPVGAHEINTSYTKIQLNESSLKLVVSLDEGDLLTGFDIDTNGDGTLLYSEMAAGAAHVFDYVEGRIAVKLDGETFALNRRPPQPFLDEEGNLFLNAGFEASLTEIPNVIELEVLIQERLSEDHRNLLELNVAGLDPIVSVFSNSTPSQKFVLKEPGLWRRVTDFTWWGVEHIFIGYDHIMFLLALIVVGGRLGILVKIVSAFTVAHSITLILSVLDVVSLPPRLIESGIALSIAYVAAENFWLRRVDHRWVLTFIFGLIHGFGFANVLRELGLPSTGLLASLLAFNVGVEIGQIVIVAILFPLVLWSGRTRYRDRFVRTVSALVLLFGLGWFVERVFDLSYMPL